MPIATNTLIPLPTGRSIVRTQNCSPALSQNSRGRRIRTPTEAQRTKGVSVEGRPMIEQGGIAGACDLEQQASHVVEQSIRSDVPACLFEDPAFLQPLDGQSPFGIRPVVVAVSLD